MNSPNRRDYLNRADAYGVRNLTSHNSSVQTEIPDVCKGFLIWVKPDFSNPMDCNYSLTAYQFEVISFIENNVGQNCVAQILCFLLAGRKTNNGGYLKWLQ
jgi:hypothetical protein